MENAAGYSGTPLVQKLGLKRGMTVRLVNAPDDYWDVLGVEPASIDLIVVSEDDDQRADFIHIFADDSTGLDEGLVEARKGMRTDGLVWASWPKKSSGVSTEIGRSEVMIAGKRVGLVDIKVCAVDETWSGLKFVIPVADRKGD